MPDRTPEQRERDRLEREARRAKREGRAAPAPPPPPPVDETILPSPPMGERAQDDDAALPPPPPPATGRDWRRAAGEPDPDPPLVRRVPAGTPRAEEVHAHAEPIPEPEPPEAPARRIPPAPPLDGDEPALGTRRVSAGHRLHLPQRKPRSPRPPGPASGAGRTGRRIGAILALAAVALVLWFAASLFQPFAGKGGGDVTVTIPQGASVSQVGDLLEKEGVIGSSFFFRLRARLEGRDQLSSGLLKLRRDMSFSAALDALEADASNAKPVAKRTKLTLPEGLSREEVAATVKEAGISGDYVAATERSRALDPGRFGAPKGATLEGFLFPATYDLKPRDDVDDLVAQQLAAFRRTLDSVDLRRARRGNLTPYDVLVIASMVEREAGIAKDRPLIAAVIYNRLKEGIPLGIDATLRYELKNWTKPLKVSELEADTPYNTRTNAGLPPSPIGNPGLASIQAAARPANADFLYFVVKPCGNGASTFSKTAAEHDAAVAAYNAKRDELNGKSPVTC